MATANLPSSVTDRIVADAKSMPELIDKLSKADPTAADQFRGKALAASRTPWGTLLSGGIAYLVARYGLGWDTGMTDLLAGAGVLMGSYVMRYVTTTHIASWIVAPNATTKGN